MFIHIYITNTAQRGGRFFDRFFELDLPQDLRPKYQHASVCLNEYGRCIKGGDKEKGLEKCRERERDKSQQNVFYTLY